MSNTNITFELTSYSYFDLLGADSEKLLQGQISVDATKINHHTAQLAVLCSPKGRIVALFHIHRIADGFRFVLPKEIIDHTITHIKKYAVFYKVSISPASDSSSMIVVQTDSKEKLEQSPINIPGIDSVIIYKDNLKSIANYAESTNTEIMDSDRHWYWSLASNRIAWLTADTCEQFLPHNLNLPKLAAVDFNKGCFTGQEVIARMQYKGKLKQHLQLLKTDQIVDLAPLDKLYQDDRKVAEIICCVSLQDFGSLVLALVKDSADKNKAFLSSNMAYELLFD